MVFLRKTIFIKLKVELLKDKVVSVEELITLAKLPSRQELLGMLSGALRVIIFIVAVALDQVKIQKKKNNLNIKKE